MKHETTRRHGSRPKRLAVRYLVVAVLCMFSALAFAHIANEETQFPDIGTSHNKDAIVLLVALDILPQTPTFQPDQPFTRKDLAAWAALAHRKDAGSEAPDMAKLIEDGTSYVGSLTGNATATDINKAIFDGKLKLSNASQTFTHDQAAAFVADHLSASYVAALGVSSGPTGTISQVKTGTAPDGDTSYTLVIGGKDFPVYDHARVVGPTDLTLWQGKDLARSYQAKTSDGPALTYLVLAQSPATNSQPAQASPVKSPQGSTASSSLPKWIIGLVIVVVVLALIAFSRPRKRPS